MGNTTAIPFTTSMKQFETNDTQFSVEQFYAISGTTVIFNTNLVDSITLLTRNSKSVRLRQNNRDGTCIDRQFDIAWDRISEALPFVTHPAVADAHVS